MQVRLLTDIAPSNAFGLVQMLQEIVRERLPMGSAFYGERLRPFVLENEGERGDLLCYFSCFPCSFHSAFSLDFPLF